MRFSALQYFQPRRQDVVVDDHEITWQLASFGGPTLEHVHPDTEVLASFFLPGVFDRRRADDNHGTPLGQTPYPGQRLDGLAQPLLIGEQRTAVQVVNGPDASVLKWEELSHRKESPTGDRRGLGICNPNRA